MMLHRCSFSAVRSERHCVRPGLGCSGGIDPGDPGALQQQVAALERAAAAVVEARQRQRAWQLQKRADAAVAAVFAGPSGSSHWPAAGADAGGAAQPRQLSRLAGGGGIRQPPSRQGSGSAGGSNPAGASALGPLGLLHCLQPAARVVLLLSLEQRQRQHMLAAMSDSERAGLVVLLDESARLQVLECSCRVGKKQQQCGYLLR